MLTYLFGDVIRIFAGDVTLREIKGVKITQALGLGITILMVVLSLVMLHNTKR